MESQPNRQRRARWVAGALVVALAAGAGLGLGFGIPDVTRRSGQNATIVLRARASATAAELSEARAVLLRRLAGQGFRGGTVSVSGTQLTVEFFEPGVSDVESVLETSGIASALAQPGRIEEREALQELPLQHGVPPVRLTSCPLDVLLSTPCFPPAVVHCVSTTRPGCTDADLAGRDVTFLSVPATDLLPSAAGFEHPVSPSPNPGEPGAAHDIGGIDVFQLGPLLITGDAIAGARATLPPPQSSADVHVREWVVDFTLKPGATKRYAAITRHLVGKRLAIVLDRAVVTAPEIGSPTTNGHGFIVGRFTEGEAKGLAAALSSGALPIPLSVGPSQTASQQPSNALVVVGAVCLLLLIALGVGAARRRREVRAHPSVP